MIKSHGLIVLFFYLLFHTACDFINPPEEIPAYLYVKNFAYQPNPSLPDNTHTSNITHAYIFIGEEAMGLFALPALVPVFQEGVQPVIIDPVIPENGQYNNLRISPFYQRFESSISLTRAQTDTLQPTTSYIDDTHIAFLEDFEGSGVFFSQDRDGNDSTYITFTTEMVREGNRSGYILLTSDHPVIDAATPTDQLFDLKDRNIIYLEVDYKCDTEVLFGLIGFDGTGPIGSSYEFGILPKGEWNKIYFNLTSQVRVSNFNQYQIAITAGLPSGKSKAEVYLDNIKLIYY